MINAWVVIRLSKFFDVAYEVKVSAVFVVRFGCVEVAVSSALRFDCFVLSEI